MRTILLAAALVLGVGPAFAEETVIHKEGPGRAVVGPGPARDVTVEKHSDCASKTVHKEDGAGDSKTVTKSNCD